MFWKKAHTTPIKMHPAERFENQGWEAFGQGDFDASVEFFRAAIEAAPMGRGARQGLRDALYQRALNQKNQKQARQLRQKRNAETKRLNVTPSNASGKPQTKKTKQKPAIDSVAFGAAIEHDAWENPEINSLEELALQREASNPGFASSDGDRLPRRPKNQSRIIERLQQTFTFDDEDEPEHDAESVAALGTFAEEFRPPEQRRRVTRERVRVGSSQGPSKAIPWVIGVTCAFVLFGVALAARGGIEYFLSEVALPTVPAQTEEEKFPAELTAALSEASDLMRDRKPTEAVALLEGTLAEFEDYQNKISPSLVIALRVDAQRLLRDQDYPAALKMFERTTRLEPLNPNNWIEYARTQSEYARSSKSGGETRSNVLLERAKESYHRALELDKENPSALLGLGHVLTFMQDRKEAVRTYERIIDLAPHSPEANEAQERLSQLVGNRG